MSKTDAKELDRVCQIMDKLTVDTLTLIEREIQQQIDFERLLVDGESNLLKSRYIMGHNMVSKLQLPTADSPEFEALAVIQDETTENDRKILDLHKPEKVDSEVKIQEPLKWYGVLVPQCLHVAQAKYRQALVGIVELVNTRNYLKYSCDTLRQLGLYKSDLLKEE